MKYFAQQDKTADLLLHLFRQVLHIMAGHQPIAMRQIQCLSSHGQTRWATMHFHARLLGQPSKRPNIVIANKEVYLYAFVGDALEGIQEGAVLFFASVAPKILTPKIKDISQ
jgi:hypothetical protein